MALLLQLCATGAEDPVPPSAGALLAGVVANLPREPFLAEGQILVRGRGGKVLRELGFDMRAHWGGNPPLVSYTLRDAFGSAIEQMTVSRPRGEWPRFEFARGDPPAAVDLPDLFVSVQETDISWTDLTLSFLWWEAREGVDTDRVSGRRCQVVEVVPPASAGGAAGPYARVRLWIDEAARMLLRAEAYDAADRLLCRLWVKSVKKIDERWMIKDMEFQRFPATHRTRVRVNNVNEGVHDLDP